jgi:hypothetical protein
MRQLPLVLVSGFGQEALITKTPSTPRALTAGGTLWGQVQQAQTRGPPLRIRLCFPRLAQARRTSTPSSGPNNGCTCATGALVCRLGRSLCPLCNKQ